MRLILTALIFASELLAQHVIGGCQVFPPTNFWNQRVDNLKTDPRSNEFIAAITGASGAHHMRYDQDMHITVVNSNTQAFVPISYTSFLSDFAADLATAPIPLDPTIIESGSDAHFLVVDSAACILYEGFQAVLINGNTAWQVGSTGAWDLNSNAIRQQFASNQVSTGTTSADLAGLSIVAGVLLYDEATTGINHALRFTCCEGNTNAGMIPYQWMWPGRHAVNTTSTPNTGIVSGQRFRLKSSWTCGQTLSTINQNIVTALKQYGLVLADIGLTAEMQFATDSRWNDTDLQIIMSGACAIQANSDLEVVWTEGGFVDQDSYFFNQAMQPNTPYIMTVTKDKFGRTSHDPLLGMIQKDITGNYTVLPSDNLHQLTYNGSTNITVTAPVANLFPGMNWTYLQAGSGSVTVVGSGITLDNPDNANKTAGPNSKGAVDCNLVSSTLKCQTYGRITP